MLATHQMLILKFTMGINNLEETDQNKAKSSDTHPEVESRLEIAQAVPAMQAVQCGDA